MSAQPEPRDGVDATTFDSPTDAHGNVWRETGQASLAYTFARELLAWLKQRPEIDVPKNARSFTIQAAIGDAPIIRWECLIKTPRDRSSS